MREDRQLYDSRVLGGGGFVQKVLEGVEKAEEVRATLIRQKVDINLMAEKVAKENNIDLKMIFQRNRMKKVSEAKALLTFLATEHLGKSNAEMARLLKMTPSAAGRARMRGMKIADDFDVQALLQVN
jgi:hypothetical protein